MGPSLAELESQVPEQMVASVWAGVQSGVVVAAKQERAAARRPSFNWLVPTLAAATLILIFSTGFLAMELGRLRDREATLAQQVTEQQRWMAELEIGPSTNPVARTAALAGRSPFTRALSRQESISISGLQLLLERMPGERSILSQPQLDAALRSRSPLTAPFLREALAGIGGRDGVRARDLIRALEALDVNPNLTVPTADLMEILS